MKKLIYLIAMGVLFIGLASSASATVVDHGATDKTGDPITIDDATNGGGVFNFTPSPSTCMGVATSSTTFSAICASSKTKIADDGMEYGYTEPDSTVYRRAQQTDNACTSIATPGLLPGSDWKNLNNEDRT